MRILKRIAFWLVALMLSPLFSLIYIVGSGMQSVFLSEFGVKNRTARRLWITPIGTSKSGKFGKGMLRQFLTVLPPISSFRSKDHRVEPGGSIRVVYCWDSANFTDIVARNAEGECRQLVVDPDPPKGRSYPSKQTRYAIEDWESLPPAEPSVVKAMNQPDRVWQLNGLFLTGLIVSGLYLWIIQFS